MLQEEKERFEVDLERGILILNGAHDGTVSNKMFEEGIRRFIKDSHEIGIEKPIIKSEVCIHLLWVWKPLLKLLYSTQRYLKGWRC